MKIIKTKKTSLPGTISSEFSSSPVLSGTQNRRETRKKKNLTLRSVEFLRWAHDSLTPLPLRGRPYALTPWR